MTCPHCDDRGVRAVVGSYPGDVDYEPCDCPPVVPDYAAAIRLLEIVGSTYYEMGALSDLAESAHARTIADLLTRLTGGEIGMTLALSAMGRFRASRDPEDAHNLITAIAHNLARRDR